MQKLTIAGGWYAEAWPAGQYACLVPRQKIVTHLGDIPLPNGTDNPLFLRGFIQFQGDFKLAGQSHEGRGTWEYKRARAAWEIVTADSYGVNPVIYDHNGLLHLGALQYGSQGFRFVDAQNRIWTGDETYADPSRRIWEWTQHGDLTVGFSDVYVVGLYNNKRYILSSGGAYGANSVRFNRTGDNCAVTYHDTTTLSTTLMFFSIAELSLFPQQPVHTDTPPHTDIYTNVYTDTPPMTEFPRNAWAIVEQMHARFAADFEPNEHGARAWTQKVIQQLVYDFPAGGWCWKSSTPNNPPSKDVAARQLNGNFEGWDLLSAASLNGPRDLSPYPPAWHDLSGQTPITVFPINWLGVAHTDAPPHTDTPPDTLTARVAILESKVQTLEQDMSLVTAGLVRQQAEIDSMGRALAALGATTPRRGEIVTSTGRVYGIGVTVKGTL